jgi:hypothetical protein
VALATPGPSRCSLTPCDIWEAGGPCGGHHRNWCSHPRRPPGPRGHESQRQALFPVLALGAPRGCQLPDAILHGKRSLRPRSRAVQRLAAAEFRVRLFSSLGLVVAPPAREPGRDTSVTAFSRLHHLAPGRPPLLTVRLPGATGLASCLSGCLSSTVQRQRFYYRRLLGRFSRVLPRPRVLPGANTHFVPPFSVFPLADPLSETARVVRPC